MNKFTKTVPNQAPSPGDARVMKVEQDVKTVVQQFQFGKIDRPGDGDYNAAKARFGALAATDSDRKARTRKDERFVMNPMLRERLSIEVEEKRAIDERVSLEISSLAEEARRKGFEQGQREGREQGHQEAYTSFAVEAKTRIAGLEALIEAFEGAREEIFKANERYWVDLVFRVCKMILLRELATDREHVHRLARSLIDRVGVRENIRLGVPAREVETLALLKEKLEASFGGLKNLQIEIVPGLEGGCKLETRWNAIDAGLDTQLKGLALALLGPEPDARPEASSDVAPGARDEE